MISVVGQGILKLFKISDSSLKQVSRGRRKKCGAEGRVWGFFPADGMQAAALQLIGPLCQRPPPLTACGPHPANEPCPAPQNPRF